MKFGRNQQMGMVAMAGPFIVATAALFLDKANFDQWVGFCQVFLPVTLGTVLGLGAVVKVKAPKP